MTNLAGSTIPGLKRIPVTVRGDWSVRFKGSKPEWYGAIHAKEPVVALILLDNGVTEWCKSERPGREESSVRILFGGFGAGDPRVQINAGAQGGSRNAVVQYDFPNKKPVILPEMHIETGQFFELVKIDSTPPVSVLLLFISTSDIEGERKGLWRLRGELLDSIPEPFQEVLTRGRTGTIDV